jgi:Phage integrase family
MTRLVFADQEGRHRHPERFWRAFKSAQRQCAKSLGDGAPPVIAIHDLRHTHTTLLLADREPVKTVSERLGHATITITLAVYGHVMPGDQKRAVDAGTGTRTEESTGPAYTDLSDVRAVQADRPRLLAHLGGPAATGISPEGPPHVLSKLQSRSWGTPFRCTQGERLQCDCVALGEGEGLAGGFVRCRSRKL